MEPVHSAGDLLLLTQVMIRCFSHLQERRDGRQMEKLSQQWSFSAATA